MDGNFTAATAKTELRRFFRFMLSEMKPKGKLLTPFNMISIPVILLGLVLLVIRFTQGLGSITNLNQEYPWGLWIGFDFVTGVAFAGGAYVITFMVYILRLEKYHPIVRVVVLNGFLAYVFYAGALLLDLGRPWNVVNPIIGNKFGVSSVLLVVLLLAGCESERPADAPAPSPDRPFEEVAAASGLVFSHLLSITFC